MGRPLGLVLPSGAELGHPPSTETLGFWWLEEKPGQGESKRKGDAASEHPKGHTVAAGSAAGENTLQARLAPRLCCALLPASSAQGVGHTRPSCWGRGRAWPCPALRPCRFAAGGVVDPQQALLRHLRADEADAYQGAALQPFQGHRLGHRHHLCHRHR